MSIGNHRRIPGVAALMFAAVAGARPVVQMSSEERAANQAKLDAQRQEADRARRAESDRLRAVEAARTSAAINRWTGKPHEHRRSIARRLKQVSP